MQFELVDHLLLHFEFLYLADGVGWIGVDELDEARYLELGNVVHAKGLDLLIGDRLGLQAVDRRLVQLDPCANLLANTLVRYADHLAIEHGWMCLDKALHFSLYCIIIIVIDEYF